MKSRRSSTISSPRSGSPHRRSGRRHPAGRSRRTPRRLNRLRTSSLPSSEWVQTFTRPRSTTIMLVPGSPLRNSTGAPDSAPPAGTRPAGPAPPAPAARTAGCPSSLRLSRALLGGHSAAQATVPIASLDFAQLQRFCRPSIGCKPFRVQCAEFAAIVQPLIAISGSERLAKADVELEGVVGVARVDRKADVEAHRPDRAEIAQARSGADPAVSRRSRAGTRLNAEPASTNATTPMVSVRRSRTSPDSSSSERPPIGLWSSSSSPAAGSQSRGPSRRRRHRTADRPVHRRARRRTGCRRLRAGEHHPGLSSTFR